MLCYPGFQSPPLFYILVVAVTAVRDGGVLTAYVRMTMPLRISPLNNSFFFAILVSEQVKQSHGTGSNENRRGKMLSTKIPSLNLLFVLSAQLNERRKISHLHKQDK